MVGRDLVIPEGYKGNTRKIICMIGYIFGKLNSDSGYISHDG